MASRNSRIRLNADGSASLEDIPDAYIDGFGDSHGSAVSGQGQWEIDATDFGYGLTVTILPGGSMAHGIYHGSSMLIRGQRVPYRIEMQLGDPDSDESITYERHES